MRVASCCGCFSVKTGVIIIGLLIVLLSGLSIIYFAVNAFNALAIYVSPIINFLCAVLLIIGAQNREAHYIFPMLSIIFANLILILPVIVVHIIQLGIVSKQTETYYGIAFAILAIFSMRVSTCCGCCSVSMGVLTIGRLTVVCSALAIMINAVRGISIVASYVPYVVHLLCGGSLIVAVKTRKSKYNLPMLSMLIVSLISTIPLRVVHFIEKSVLDGESVGFCVQVLFLVGLGVAWLVYLYTVVNSFYEELLREEYTDTKVDGNVNVNLSDKPHLQPV